MGRMSNSGLGSGSKKGSQLSLEQGEYGNKIKDISSGEKIKNKAEHIFGDKNIGKHNLKDVLKENDNDKTKAYNSVNNAIQDYVSSKNIKDGFIVDKINYNGHVITFKGIVDNGTYKSGTIYITKEDFINEKK